MSEQKQLIRTKQHSLQDSSSRSNRDEMEFREFFGVLWEGKWIILFSTFFCLALAVGYVFNAQEWWSSKAKIAEPQPQNMSAYQQQVKQFQPVFDVYQEDGTVLVSEELDYLVNPKVLFKRFIDEFNSANNKREFLDSSDDFQQYKNALNNDKELTNEASMKVYIDWFQKISAKAVNRTSDRSPYDVSFQATTKEGSYVLLSKYIQIIKRKSHKDALNNLQAIVNGKRKELTQQKQILETQAKNKLLVEAERARYAMAIAEAAGVSLPVQTNSSNELFGIDLGAKALEAKVKALESVKNLSVVEPRLQQINAKLEMLENLKIDRSIQFQTFRFLDNVEQPIARDKPKRALIVVLGVLLGCMLGVAIVLVRIAFRREES
ncbi:Wzz/FepE/Etk N-terminal domain-containing protein [Vibrio tubiashii]|uniref:LPS O-antigen chain length determinant protein WzzB n=3 Tax=Vibrio tubiashii TaxID=29498 RepID=UPI001EFC81FD|nr:Wzz/FepE/Etk N-terminal domain-containing protein [Vibrio tubiashii]MCG9617744.1 Wzz/FepE/Etk N-terminal domain-containing protein [Vibrio tubiashii]